MTFDCPSTQSRPSSGLINFKRSDSHHPAGRETPRYRSRSKVVQGNLGLCRVQMQVGSKQCRNVLTNLRRNLLQKNGWKQEGNVCLACLWTTEECTENLFMLTMLARFFCWKPKNRPGKSSVQKQSIFKARQRWIQSDRDLVEVSVRLSQDSC